MSLTPPLQINFDGVGLGADDDYVLDEAGVGHFHRVKAGSTWQFDLKFTGVDTTAVSWNMDVRASIGAVETLLSSTGSGASLITVTPNPTTTDLERVRFSVSAAGTLANLQANGQGLGFVYDILVAAGGSEDMWVSGSGSTRATVTR